jgi:hypothetical protein
MIPSRINQTLNLVTFKEEKEKAVEDVAEQHYRRI